MTLRDWRHQETATQRPKETLSWGLLGLLHFMTPYLIVLVLNMNKPLWFAWALRKKNKKPHLNTSQVACSTIHWVQKNKDEIPVRRGAQTWVMISLVLWLCDGNNLRNHWTIQKAMGHLPLDMMIQVPVPSLPTFQRCYFPFPFATFVPTESAFPYDCGFQQTVLSLTATRKQPETGFAYVFASCIRLRICNWNLLQSEDILA